MDDELTFNKMRDTGRKWKRAKDTLDGLNDERKAVAIAAYQDGWRRTVIREELHITEATLSAWLRDAGVSQVRPRSRYATPEEEAAALAAAETDEN
ncbi:DNA binding protein [Gordonia phage Morgana]|uniref:DNA binding protein n=1 Tax=Gordonia phage Morgana TaxID=3137292 RepID=A0AAX4RAZ0_9CAUD